MATRSFRTALAARSKRDGELYSIEEGETSFTATKPTKITDVEVIADVTTVQEYTQYTFKFTPTVETEIGAYVMIQFPKLPGDEQDYVFDNSLNSMSTFGGLFAAKSFDVAFVVDRANLKIETKFGTQQSAPSGPATVVVS